MRRLALIMPLLLAALAACAAPADDAGATEAGTETANSATSPAPMDPAAMLASASAAGLACAPTAEPAALAERPSPYDSTAVKVGEGFAKMCYSRPQLRGRTMIGGEAVPYDRLWRFGANEPTIIHVGVPASIAGINVAPGSYSLYTVPKAGTEWTLIVNASTSQWGHEGQYTPEVEAQEVGRAQVPAESVDQPVESFTIRPSPEGTGVIAEWQNSRIRIPITPAG
jgi:hypothetical protein